MISKLASRFADTTSSHGGIDTENEARKNYFVNDVNFVIDLFSHNQILVSIISFFRGSLQVEHEALNENAKFAVNASNVSIFFIIKTIDMVKGKAQILLELAGNHT